MTWYSWYVDVWDKLVTLVKTISDFGENVYYGEKFPLDKYPSCYVCPLPISVTPASMMLSSNDAQFEFGVVVHNPDVKEGNLQAFNYVGQIYDLLVADRSLSGTVCNLEILQVIPNWRALGKGVEDHWVGLRVKLTKIRA